MGFEVRVDAQQLQTLSYATFKRRVWPMHFALLFLKKYCGEFCFEKKNSTIALPNFILLLLLTYDGPLGYLYHHPSSVHSFSSY